MAEVRKLYVKVAHVDSEGNRLAVGSQVELPVDTFEQRAVAASYVRRGVLSDEPVATPGDPGPPRRTPEGTPRKRAARKR